jgi:hypothetical protein
MSLLCICAFSQQYFRYILNREVMLWIYIVMIFSYDANTPYQNLRSVNTYKYNEIHNQRLYTLQIKLVM